MARSVAIKYVVSFTSQDETHSVQNLLEDGSFKKWLSNPKDRAGAMEAIFQLEQPSVISYLDIGTHMCSNIEIQVGKSEWPLSRQFEPLIRNVCLMTLSDIRLDRNSDNTSMFGVGNFCSEAANGVWDRIRVVCRQIHRKDVQFGVTFLRIKSKQISNVPPSVDTLNQVSHSKSNNQTSPKGLTNEMIKRHFFKENQPASPDANEGLTNQLLMISSSGENGTNSVQGLSRTAQILLAAKENAGKYSPNTRYKTESKNSRKSLLFSEAKAQKHSPTMNEEMDIFISQLKISRKELHSVTIADLRHRFERKKRRKLTNEERKTYVSKVTDYINKVFSMNDMQQEQVDTEVIQQQSKRLKVEHRDTSSSDRHVQATSSKTAISKNKSTKQQQQKLENQRKEVCKSNTADSEDDDGDPRLVIDFTPDRAVAATTPATIPAAATTTTTTTTTFANNDADVDEEVYYTPVCGPLSTTFISARSSREAKCSSSLDHFAKLTPSKVAAMDMKKDVFSQKRKYEINVTPERSSIAGINYVQSPEDDVMFNLELAESERVSCPLCGDLFPPDVIEVHANACADSHCFDL